MLLQIKVRKLKRGRKIKKEMKSQPKHPWCKKVAAKNLKKAMLKKMGNQNEWPRPSAVDGTKIKIIW